MRATREDEWGVIETLLPSGWREAARDQKAFQRARYTKDPARLLRLLLFHAVNDGGLRETVAQARAAGIAQMSQVALTDAHGAELLERTPMAAGDVLLADRNYLRPAGVEAAVAAGTHVLIRLRWTHSPMRDAQGRAFHALGQAQKLRVGQIGAWPVRLLGAEDKLISGRVVATKLPAPLAARAERRVAKTSKKKGKTPDPRSLQAAHFVMLFTTLSTANSAAHSTIAAPAPPSSFACRSF